MFTCIWDKTTKKKYGSQFTQFSDSLRAELKDGGLLRYALNDFFIRNIVVKADGGFIVTAEEFSSSTSGNNLSRYDLLYNPYSLSSGGYYYNPYNNYYRPLSSYANRQTTRYYYDNILVLSISKTGQVLWSKVLHKSQFSDDEENFLSFSILASGSEIHFLFNEDRKYQVVSDQSVSANGVIKRYPTLKSPQKGYEFMPSLSKQTGANQIIIPCAYRNNICFAKIDF